MSRILVITSYPKSLINFRKDFLHDLVKEGNEVIAISSRNEQVIKELKSLNVDFKEINIDRTGLNPIKDFLTFLKLSLLIYKLKPDILFSYTVKSVLYVSLIGRLFRIRSFILITGTGYLFNAKSFFNKIFFPFVVLIYKVALKKNEKVFFQNKDSQTLFHELKILDNQKQSYLVNGSGVNLNYFQFKQMPQATNFLMIARLLVDKGVIEFLEAAKSIKKNYKEVLFTLVGPYDDNPSSIQPSQLNKYITSNSINYLGEIDDVRDVLDDCTCFVLPSYHEGLPRSILEAMATGRPIITTDIPGCRETITNKNGILIPSKDALALEGAMMSMILNPAIYKNMGINSRKLAEEKFDVNIINHLMLTQMSLK